MSANPQDLVDAREVMLAEQSRKIHQLYALNAELLAALEGMMRNHYEPHTQEWINAANAVAKARN